MAAKIACKASDFLRNTGSDSQLLPEAPVMLIAMDKDFKFTLDNLDDAVAFFTEAAHNTGKDKVYPMFGTQVPLDYLTNNDSADVTQTTDRGQITFVQYGFITKNFGTLGGGLCFARALQSFNGASLAFIEVDASGRLFCKINKDGTFSGMPASQVFSPKIGSADFKNSARTNFQISYDPIIYTNFGKIISTDAGILLLDVIGLIDLKLTDADDSSITEIKIGVQDECCGDEQASELGADLLDPTNFIVTDKADGTVKTVTDVTISGEVLILAGTWTTGHTYHVAGADSSVLFGNSIEGYDIVDGVDVTIP